MQQHQRTFGDHLLGDGDDLVEGSEHVGDVDWCHGLSSRDGSAGRSSSRRWRR